MAVDEAMLEALCAGTTSPALRVYTWRPPAISLGRFQKAASSVDLDACKQRGIDVVRRPTGGRAILHTEEEVTFSIVASARRLGTTGVMDSYRALARGTIAALRSLGLDARLVERGGRAASPLAASDPACFAVRARCDLVVGSSKLVGSAQVHRSGLILQQNSLPLRIRLDDWNGVFVRAAQAPQAAGLWEAAGREVPYAEVARVLRAGFGEALGVVFEDSAPSDGEKSRATRLAHCAGIRAGALPP
jgi:lipoate-protein ligase A